MSNHLQHCVSLVSILQCGTDSTQTHTANGTARREYREACSSDDSLSLASIPSAATRRAAQPL